MLELSKDSFSNVRLCLSQATKEKLIEYMKGSGDFSAIELYLQTGARLSKLIAAEIDYMIQQEV